MYEFNEEDCEAFKNLAETGKMNVETAQAIGAWLESLEDDIDAIWKIKTGYTYPDKYEINEYGIVCIQEYGDCIPYHREVFMWPDIINKQQTIEKIRKDQEEKRKQEERNTQIRKELKAKATEKQEREELARLKQKYEGSTQ